MEFQKVLDMLIWASSWIKSIEVCISFLLVYTNLINGHFSPLNNPSLISIDFDISSSDSQNEILIPTSLPPIIFHPLRQTPQQITQPCQTLNIYSQFLTTISKSQYPSLYQQSPITHPPNTHCISDPSLRFFSPLCPHHRHSLLPYLSPILYLLHNHKMDVLVPLRDSLSFRGRAPLRLGWLRRIL